MQQRRIEPHEEEVHRTTQVRREEAEVTREGAPASARHR